MSVTKLDAEALRTAIPKECPVTHLPYFTLIQSQYDESVWVPTFGGPFDSYTIPVQDEDGYFYRERFDHDAGCWVEGSEVVEVRPDKIADRERLLDDLEIAVRILSAGTKRKVHPSWKGIDRILDDLSKLMAER